MEDFLVDFDRGCPPGCKCGGLNYHIEDFCSVECLAEAASQYEQGNQADRRVHVPLRAQGDREDRQDRDVWPVRQRADAVEETDQQVDGRQCSASGGDMSSQWESVDRMEARESRRKWQEEEMRRAAEKAPALDDQEWL